MAIAGNDKMKVSDLIATVLERLDIRYAFVVDSSFIDGVTDYFKCRMIQF
jgi:hypothetical protein